MSCVCYFLILQRYNGTATMSSSTGPNFLSWMIMVLCSVSIALFVMATLHFQHVINIQEEKIMELSERLTWLEEQQNGERTAKSSLRKVRNPALARSSFLFSWIPARSCEVLWDFTGILQESCTRFLQIPTRSRKISQECKKKGPFLGRSC